MNRSRIVFAALLSVYACAAFAEDPIFEVPRLDGIRIDGQSADWGARGFRVEIMKDENGRCLPASDFDSGFRLGWDTNGLLVLAQALDDMFVESDSEAELWRLDGIEMFMATRKGGPDMVQPCVTPGMDPKHPALRWHIHDYRQNPALTSTPATVDAASAPIRGGYVIEACIPWKDLGLTPTAGDEIGFQIYINDADGPAKKISSKWFPRGDTHADTKNMHRVILATNASAPVVAAASGSYENMDHVKITVAGATELIGREVAAQSGGKALSTGTFASADGRASAELILPMPAPGERYEGIEIASGHGVIANLDLPPPEEIASRNLIWSEFALMPFCFFGERLPDGDFKNRCEAEKLVGPYAKTLTYYDAGANAVATAATEGRYGVVLTIQPKRGGSFTRFLTAFQEPDAMRNFKPWLYDPHLRIDLPAELNPETAVAQAHSNDVSRLVADLLLEAMLNDPRGAVLLAGLQDARSTPGSELASESTDTIERQWWVNFKRKYYGMAGKFPEPFVAPRPAPGSPAPSLHIGTCAEADVATDAVERIDAMLSRWAGDTDEAFAVCLARHGVVFFHKAYGIRNGKPMTVNTQSWMASITKLMSGTLMMMLVDQDKVGLDDPIEAYLPAFRGVHTKAPITIRHLYTHSTGLDGHWGDDMNDMEERVAYHAPYLAVGDRFQYNGAGFALGGKIIEMVSGECIPLFFKHHLLGPLGMTNTTVVGTSGDASSTPLDMARLGQMLLNRGAYGDQRFMSAETFQQMLPQKLTKTLGPTATKVYGIGTDTMGTDTLGEGTFGHGAASAATFLISPTNDLVVVMCRDSAGKNFSTYHPEFLKTVSEILGK